MTKKKEITIRSSAAEYLTFITATGESGIEAIYADENVWLTQKMMGVLYNVETNTINYHLKKIFRDMELDEDSVIQKFRITAADGKTYETNHYNLKAIIAVGNKVDSPKAVQFRKWANDIIEQYTIKAYGIIQGLGYQPLSNIGETLQDLSTEISSVENEEEYTVVKEKLLSIQSQLLDLKWNTDLKEKFIQVLKLEGNKDE